jgi:LPXTG-motif cell wall-anchored protein
VKNVLAGLVVAAGLSLGASSVALAGTYPDDDTEIVVSVTVVTPGGTVTATLTGCLLGETVRFTIANVTVDITCTGGGTGDVRLMAAPAEGSATASLQAPTTPGTYTLTAVGLTSGVTESITITVAGAAAAPGDGAAGGLPATGSDTDATLLVAGGALTAGVALTGVAWFRRRRPANAAA